MGQSSLELWAARERSLTHKERVHVAGGLAAFPDGPHDQGLPAPHVAAGEDTGHARLVVGADGNVAAIGEPHPELREHRVGLGPEEAEREEHEVAFDLELASGDLGHHRTAVLGLPVEADAVELLHVALAVAA